MFDFLGLRIHFKDEFTSCIQQGEDIISLIDFDDLINRGLRIENSIFLDDEGKLELSDLRHPWDSIPSSFTGIAFKVFQGSGFRHHACVEIKASPAKVMQGHNVYGSESFLHAATFVLDSLKLAMPDFCEMLDFTMTDVFRFDSTYSVQLESRDVLQGALDALTRVSHKYLRPSRQGEFESTVYFNSQRNNPNSGRTTSLCIYSKLDEVEHQLEDLKKKKRKEHTDRYDRVINELSSERLNEFAQNRLRFEARFKPRWFVKHDIPQNLWAFISYIEAFENESDITFCQWAWRDVMKDLLNAIEGSSLSVVHDHQVLSLLHTFYDAPLPSGKVSKAKAYRLFGFYDRLKHSTYEQVRNTMSKSTFFRNCQELMAIGLSKSDIQNLHKENHIPLAQVLQFDFDNQRPEGWQEPTLNCINSGHDLLSYLTGRVSVDVGINELNTVINSLEERGLLGINARALAAGREVRLNEHKSMSFMWFEDGSSRLVFHKPNDIYYELDDPTLDQHNQE